MSNTAKQEDMLPYGTLPFKKEAIDALDDDAIQYAIKILEKRIKTHEYQFRCPEDCKKYLLLKYSPLQHEEFHVLFLNVKLEMIEDKVMGIGSVQSCPAYAREIAKAALLNNALAIVISHNHPSGVAKASDADIAITKGIRDACDTISVKLLDHLIVGNREVKGFYEMGLISCLSKQ